MSEKKYQIFVSSTYEDLKDTRSKIIDTILNSYHFPVGMEFFSAGDDEQWEIIKELIDESDYYLVIIGHRYGTSTDEGISYTEKEYDYAVKMGVPVMAFIRNRDVATTDSEREKTATSTRKLNSFIEKARANKMCDFWATDDDLATKVAVALPKIFHRIPRVGWVRGDSAMSPEVANEIAASSKENRELRDEIELLRRNTELKSPKLDLSVDGDWEFNLQPYKAIVMPVALSASEIPTHLHDYVSETDIVKYNKNIPSDEELKEHNLARRIFREAKNNAYLPVFQIENSGSAKANDIIVTIKFPSILGVISKRDFEKLGEIDEIAPSNPIDLAEKKYRERAKSRDALIQSSLRLGAADRLYSTPQINMPSLDALDIDESTVEGKTVTIRLKSLIHTRASTVDEGIRIFPIAQGFEDIAITIICEEFASPVTMKMPARVQ